MSVKRLLLAGLAATLIVTGALWALGSLDPAAIANEARVAFGVKDKQAAAPVSDEAPPAITVIEARRRQFVERLRLTGTIVPRRDVLVAPEIEGQQVAELSVDAGDRVEKGQLLARLARENLEAQLRQNGAEIARAEASIAQATNAITQSEARLSEAAAALERAKPLARSGYLSESILDQRQASATTARAALAIARNALRAAESEKAAAEARQNELAWRLARTEIRAPVAGLVLKRSAKVGAIASAQGEAMFRIAADGEVELLGDVPSDDLARLRTGQKAEITVGGVGTVSGSVRLIEPEVDVRTRLGKVRIFVGARPDLHVGQFAAALVETRSGAGVGVPAGAVMHDKEGAYLHVVVGDRVETRRIKTGLAADGFIEVAQGLAAGDVVVLKAGTFLGDGDRITPVPAARRPQSGVGAQAKAG
jgi:RND family efflux transporter MFP subunit